MAVKNVLVILGQSNQEGEASTVSLPVSLRGAQANTFIWNDDNLAIETLNCDAAGANQPNNTTTHLVGKCGPELSLAADAVAELGEIYIFKYAIPASSLAPFAAGPGCWNVESADLYAEFLLRWGRFATAMATAGHTINVLFVSWLQGDSDTFVEGSDVAYFGLYKRLISDTRNFLLAYSTTRSIKWVAGLFHELILPAGPGIYLTRRAKNVRAALMRAGWDDPLYRVYDTNAFSFQTDLIHLDTQGVVDCGHAQWAAYMLSYNNSMALEDYDLKSIRERCAEEFGIDLDVGTNLLTIDKRINDAIAWIVNRRKNWPFQEKDTIIEVGERSTSIDADRYGAGIFSLGQQQVQYCSFNLSDIVPREFVDFAGDGYDGLMALSFTGTTLMLRQGYQGDTQTVAVTAITTGNPTILTVALSPTLQNGTAVIPSHVPTFGVLLGGSHYTLPGSADGFYFATRLSDTTFSIPFNSTALTFDALGVVSIAREFRIAQSYFELPEDFIREYTAHLASGSVENTLYFKHSSLFERAIRQRSTTKLRPIFTILPDPLGTSSRKYMAVYPYFNVRDQLFVRYYGDAKKLVADSDTPDIPRSERFVALNAANWFVAQWQKQDATTIAGYRDLALQELERMGKEYQLSDDISEDADDFDTDIGGPIRGPAGFPDFESP